MSKVMESVLTVCAVLIVTELLRKFCPESQMVSFVGGLIALGLLVSTLGTALHIRLDVSFPEAQVERRQEELVSYVEEQYGQAVQQDAREYIQGLLAAGNVDAKEIRVSTDRNEENSIVLTEVAVWCSYPSQEERARALLQNTLGEEVQVTVRTGG